MITGMFAGNMQTPYRLSQEPGNSSFPRPGLLALEIRYSSTFTTKMGSPEMYSDIPRMSCKCLLIIILILFNFN